MITVEELLKACQEQVAKGNGSKGILLSGDDEGNTYHSCCYLFTEEVSDYASAEELGMSEKDLEDYVILG